MEVRDKILRDANDPNKVKVVLKYAREEVEEAMAYAATMAGTFNLPNFHVLPLSAVVIAPPVAL